MHLGPLMENNLQHDTLLIICKILAPPAPPTHTVTCNTRSCAGGCAEGAGELGRTACGWTEVRICVSFRFKAVF